MNILALLGPTASGKSTLAITLAKQLEAEIVSCDSMMVYRNMNIGTAKPSDEQRSNIPHHMIDILDIYESFSVRQYVTRSLDCIKDINNRGNIAILCGGTGLYAKSLCYNYTFYPTDRAIAKKIKEEYFLDPSRLRSQWYALGGKKEDNIEKNPRRFLRSMEILQITGKLPKRANESSLSLPGIKQWILMPSMLLLRERIRTRAKDMIHRGWIEETKMLMNQGLFDTPTASKALGYKEIYRYLQDNTSNVSSLIDIICTATCRYAKRQRTWFRHQHPGAKMIEFDQDLSAEEVVAKICSTR